MANSRSSVIDIDHGYKTFMEGMRRLEAGPSVKVGFLEGQKDQRDDGEPTNVEIAIWAEFGTRTEPERSFMRSTMDEHRDEYQKLAERLSVAVAQGKMDEKRALGLIGERVAADIRKKILSNIPPENAPSTLAAKYPKARTLVVSGQLAGALTYEVDLSGDAGDQK